MGCLNKIVGKSQANKRFQTLFRPECLVGGSRRCKHFFVDDFTPGHAGGDLDEELHGLIGHKLFHIRDSVFPENSPPSIRQCPEKGSDQLVVYRGIDR